MDHLFEYEDFLNEESKRLKNLKLNDIVTLKKKQGKWKVEKDLGDSKLLISQDKEFSKVSKSSIITINGQSIIDKTDPKEVEDKERAEELRKLEIKNKYKDASHHSKKYPNID